MKPFIAVDCDGVLTNGFIEKLIPYVEMKDWSGKKITQQDIKSDIRKYCSKEHFEWIETTVIKQAGFVTSFEPKEEAQEFVSWLKSRDFAFKFVTSAYNDCPYWTMEREAWLIKHFGVTRKEVVFAKDKSFVPALTLIDDLESNIADFSREQQRDGILFATPQNEAYAQDPKFKVINYNEETQGRGKLLFDSEDQVGFIHTNDWRLIKKQVEFIFASQAF